MPSPTISDQGTSSERSEAPLDEDRLASMADEGSFSAAIMEIEDDGERKHLLSVQRLLSVERRAERARSVLTWRTAAVAVGLIGFALLAAGWWLKRNA